MRDKIAFTVRLLALMVAFCAVGRVWADIETVGGITWTYTLLNGEASLGLGVYSARAVPTSITGAITIPSTLGGYEVTSIGKYAFRNCSGLTSVAIPDSVTSIGDCAFEDCRGLRSVTIPDSVISIGNYAFDNCSELKGVTIGDDLTSIGKYAFRNCSGLSSVTIPDSVTSIGDGAFSYCSGLTAINVVEGNAHYKSVDGMLLSKDGKTLIQGVNGDVTIPDSVTSIVENAFFGCSGLTSVTIGNSVTSILDAAFYGCSGLTSVTIPDLVASIGEGAFGSCSGLTSVTIGNSVMSIGYGAFNNCGGLRSVTMKGDAPSVGNYAFSYVDSSCIVLLPCENATYAVSSYRWQGMTVEYYGPNFEVDASGIIWTYTVTDGEATLGGGHPNNTAIPQTTSGVVNIPSSLGGYPVTSIGEFAFFRCKDITSVTIPDSVTSIDYWALAGCSFTEVCIPKSVTNIAYGAFSEDAYIVSFFVDESNPAYKSQDGLLLSKDGTILVHGVNGDVVVPDTVTTIAEEAFYVRIGLTSIEIPRSVTNIGTSAFCYCSGLEEVTIPDSVTEIGILAFANCESLTSVTIPDSVTSIGWGAFDSCSGLTSVTIPDSVTSIGDSAFSGCSGLTSVTIPDSVTSIGRSVFSSCNNLTNVTIPDSVEAIAPTAFDGCGKLWAKWFRTLERLSADEAAAANEVALTVTNVVVHYVTTAAVSEAVTPSEDVGIVNASHVARVRIQVVYVGVCNRLISR